MCHLPPQPKAAGPAAAACSGTTYVTGFEVMRERETGMGIAIAPAAMACGGWLLHVVRHEAHTCSIM